MIKRIFHSQVRKLFVVWLSLMILTMGTMLAGKVVSTQSLGIFWMVALMLVTFSKALLILDYYLELKTAIGPWGKLFTSSIALLLIILIGIYAVQVL